MAAALLDLPVMGATLPGLVPCFGSSLALLVRDLWIEHAAVLV
ncbi:hypothetical protein VB734_13630 [Synechococcus sp. BA-124 BA4]|nr:hypothetical protein [Synechococcus sp. BA-124 BA4]